MYTYKTISTQSESEFKDRGSRFLGYCLPASSIEEIKIELMRPENSHADVLNKS